MLAKSILRYGYPRAVYEGYVINPTVLAYGSFGPGESWVYHSWLHFYVTALSFKLFGISTWSARFPFALFGLMCVILTYALTLELFKDKKIALLSMFLLSTSVSACLLCRQCRYYAPQAFFALTSIYVYLQIISGYTRKKVWLLCLSLIALFHTTWGFFVPVFSSLVLDTVWFKRSKNWPKGWAKDLLLSAIPFFVLTVPWFFICHPETHRAPLTFLELRKNVEFSIRMINKFIFPFLINFVFLMILWFKSRSDHGFNLKEVFNIRWVQIIIPFLVINTVFSFILKHRVIRYYVHLFPIYYMLQAWIIVWFSRKTVWWIAGVMLVLIHFTNIAGSSAQHLFSSAVIGQNLKKFSESTRFYFVDYLYEITHRYEGPVSSAIEYLKKHAKAGDAIKVPLAGEPESFQFYLPEFRILNDRFFATYDFPQWIVPRDYWVRQELLKDPPEKLDEHEAYLDEIGRRYERITLPTFDIVWENRPDDLGYHKFRTVTEGLYPTMIYRKLSDEEYARRLRDFQQEKVEGRGFDRKPLIPVLIPPQS